MTEIRLKTTNKQDRQRKRIYNATGMMKGAIYAKALEIGLDQMEAELHRKMEAELDSKNKK